MAITKVINDAVDLNQTSDYSGLRLPVGTTSDVVETFTTDYLVVGGGGSGSLQGAGGAGGLRTSYNNSTTTTNSLSFPSGKTAIATYMLDNNATDISGNYNGTEVNITYNTGKYGGAAIFNGSSSYINLGSTIDDPLRTSGEFGVSLWVNINSYTLNSPIIKLLNDIYLLILYNSSNEIECRVLNSSGVQSTITYSVSLNTWYHIVWTGNSTNGVTLYLNGFSVGNAAWNGTFFTYTNTNYKLNTLGYNGAGAGYYDGKIDQVRIYDSALSSTDVSNIYNNEAQANSGGGTVAESSLTLTGGTAYDVTVGAGGIDTYTSGGSSSNGASSIFSTITSLGGGGAGATSGSSTAANGKDGGSGGGAGSNTSGSPGNGTLGQGYIGGTALFYGGSYAGGGGGGALSPGGNSASNTVAGNGGSQLNLAITGTSIGYAGGGAGSLYGTGTVGTNDSSGGPAAPSSSSSVSGGPAPFNLGGGGGGANHRSGTTNIFGGSGGSGVVILRYPTASVSSFTTTGTLNTPSTTNTVADNNYPTTNTAYYQLDGNANGYLTTNDLGTLDYPSGTGCVALYELNGNANGYLTTTDLSTVNYPAGAGCVALYELNGNPNDTSNTYNGSDTNITYNTGAFDQAAVFNGSSSGINLPSSLNTSVIDATGAFSISMWIKANDISSIQYLFCSNTSNNVDLGINTNSQGVGKIVWTIYNTSYSYLISTTTITTNTWYNIVVTYDNGSRELFINGVSQGTATKTLVESSIEPTLGYRNTGGSVRFNGLMDQVRIFNTALTQSQVTTLARGVSTSYSGAETNITYNTGAFGQAAVFNGSSSKIELPTSTFSPSTFSLSAWCNVTSDTDENTIIELVDNQTYPNNTTIVLSAGSTGYSSRFLLRNYTTNQYNYNPSGTVSKNVWKHYAMTYDGSTVKSYIDGSLVDSGSLTLSNTVGAISSIQIGLSSGNRHLNGSIDQVRIFNTALTANNITTLARGAGTAYNGAASNVTWANGRFGQAAVFNGSSSYISTGINFSTLPDTKSFSMWIKSTGSSSVGFGGMNGSSNNNGLFIFDEPAGDLSYIPKFGGYHNGDASTVILNQWNHFVVTDTNVNGNVKMYINGDEVTVTKINSTVYTNNTDMQIGRQKRGNGLTFWQTGTIDQVRVFSSELTSSQVTELYEEHYQTKFTDGSDTAIVFTEGTGTVTFSGVDPAPPQGALRTNTSYSEDGSASVIEHYNGTNWKYFDAIKYCTTNTLNFPSGAGCIASYNLDNNVDDIGNTYNGTNSNVTFTASGKFGAAAVFNGSSSRIATGLTLPADSTMSFSFWLKSASNSSGNNYFLSDFDSAANNNSSRLSLAITPNNGFRIWISDGSSNWNSTDDIDLSSYVNLWMNLVVVINGTDVKVYINGGTPTTLTSSVAFGTAGSRQQHIGRAGDYNGAYYEGSIDQVRIFNDSLTSDEVSKLYNNEIACS